MTTSVQFQKGVEDLVHKIEYRDFTQENAAEWHTRIEQLIDTLMVLQETARNTFYTK